MLRALQPDAGEDLAFSLAVLGEGRSAREVVACLNAPDDLSEEVEDTIVDYWIRFARELRRLERILVEA